MTTTTISTNTFGVSRYVVSPTAGKGNFTTIQSAITQAVSDGASSTTPACIWILPGTYTEVLTLHDYVNLQGSTDNSVTIVGNSTYGGTHQISCTNLNFSDPNANEDTIDLTSTGTMYLNNVDISNANNGVCINTSGAGTVNISGSVILGSSGSQIVTISGGGTITINSCTATYNNALTVINGGTLNLIGTIFNSGINITNGSSVINCSNSTINSLSQDYAAIFFQAGSVANITNSEIICASTTYNALDVNPASSGTLHYSSMVMSGSQVGISGSITLDSDLIYVGQAATNQQIQGGLLTNPGNSASSSLAIGSAFQNTTGLDMLLVIYISVSAATTASIKVGTGTTTTPTQQTIITGLTLAAVDIITIPIYLPNNYYALVSTSGTITASISGQQSMPI